MRRKASGDCMFWPNAFNQHVHALVHEVSIGLPLSKALLLKQPREGGEIIGRHLEVRIIQEQDLQQQGLLLQTLHKPVGHLPLRLHRVEQILSQILQVMLL